MIRGNLFNQVTDFHDLVGIKPVRRLVKYHETRIVNDGLGYSHALLVSPGKITDNTFPEMSNVTTFHGLFNRGRNLGRVHETQVCGVS